MRKTSKDYRRELKDLREKIESLHSHIKDRAIKLCEKNPDIIFQRINGESMKSGNVTKEWVDFVADVLIEDLLFIIEAIEHHNAQKERVIQKTIYD